MRPVTVPIDFSEVTEAALLFADWFPRVEQLPAHLKIEFLAIQQAELVDVIDDGMSLSCCCSPRVRALMANLRALEARHLETFP